MVLQPIEPYFCYPSIILYKTKPKSKELTAKEIKGMIYKAIQKKQKAVDPEKFNMRIVEDNLAEVEAIQQIYAMILDEELRKRETRITVRRL
jgi:hypothetical protein